MAFSGSFGNAAGPALGAPAPSIQSGPDLGDIQTESLGFLALSGESKVQLLPTPWPADNLPPPTASLMSVASHKGLVAAAGPDAVIVATTESVRKAFEGPNTGDGNFKRFQPQLTLPMPMRLSQLAFSADESYLVLAAEVGGGLAVYDVQALLQGSTQSAFELSTNGQSVRALVPNPTAEKGELFAVVTTDGKLMMANLKEKAFVTGSTGQVLKGGVSCLSWSTKGKQLVAGLGNGTAFQMTPDGVGKGDIPKPPGVDDGHHVSSITWIENNIFLLVHTPSNFDISLAPSSIFHIVTRTPPSSFVFQKITEPVGPFGLNRSPPHHFFLRLRDFTPNLQDVIIAASTASSDIGLFSRSKVPLAHDKPAGVFAMTEMSDDSRRAQLPMTGDLDDTSPIGVALDLSSKEKVIKPIPSDEMDASQTPLPALMVLNNEGVLSSWWIVYSDSVRQGTPYPGLVVAEGTQQPSAPTQPSVPAFGAPSKPAFGSTPSGAFGAPSGLGQALSPWATGSTAATTPAFGSPSAPKPTFGAPTFGATSNPAFGSSGFPAPKASLWGSAAPTTTTSSFGQPSGLGNPAGTFGSAAPASGTTAPSTGGFASFASKGGFAAASAAPSSTGSIFGAKPSTGLFGTPSTTSPFGSGATFGATPEKPVAKPTMLGSGPASTGFVLGSAFTADPNAKNEAPAASEESKGSFFGGTFGNALGEAAKAPLSDVVESKDADMDVAEDETKPEEPAKPSLTLPAATQAPTTSIFSSAQTTTGLPSTGLFGSLGQPTPAAAAKPTPSAGFNFSRPAAEEAKPTFNFLKPATEQKKAEEPKEDAFTFPSAVTKPPSPPIIKEEPASDRETEPLTHNIHEPLPPDSTSKPFYAAGDTSVSSTGTDAPLPPDFIPPPNESPESTTSQATVKKPIPADLIPPMDVPGGPDEVGESDFSSDENDGDESEGSSEEGIPEEDEENEEEEEEGSGEDVTKDLSPVSETNETPGFTPQSSFKGLNHRTPDSTLFTKIQKPDQLNQARSLFGELDRAAPVLPPPNVLASPRSPSPVRAAIPGRMLRAEPSRSVSAPGIASQMLESQRSSRQPAAQASTFALSLEQQRAEEKRRVESRAMREAAEKQALVDNEDEDLQRYLASEPTATTMLDEFVAHSNYIGPTSMDGIPAQVETVYRDINSMIDTLGLNARTLKSFMKGHTEQRKVGGRTRSDLEDEEDWCLVEAEDLSEDVVSALMQELNEGRVRDVEIKMDTCTELQKDLNKLRAKHEDIKKLHASRFDAGHLATARAQPLSAEQVAQQHDLRKDFTKFQNLLAEAEEGLTILKAKVVSQSASNGRSSTGTVPTVEAVMRTITKMTSMAEKRSGDIDVLEGQMRKLRFDSVGTTGSREGSPFATPQKNRTSMRNPGTSTYGLFYTPDSVRETTRGFQDSLMSSTGSFSRSSPPRKKLSGYTAEEKTQLRTKLVKKKTVTDRLRTALQKAGTNVRLMGDDDEKFWG